MLATWRAAVAVGVAVLLSATAVGGAGAAALERAEAAAPDRAAGPDRTGTLSVTVAPERVQAVAGTTLSLNVRIEEIAGGKAVASLAVETPAGWHADPQSAQVELQRGDWTMWAEVPVQVAVAPDAPDGLYQLKFTGETKRGKPETATATVEVTGPCGVRYPPGTPGLAGFSAWPADEGDGTTVSDVVGDAHLALQGDTGWSAGVFGGALQFGGAGAAVSAGPVLDTSGPFSVSAWVKLDRLDGWRTAAGQDGDVLSAFFLQKTGDTNRFSFSTEGGKAESTFVPEVGRWYHLAGVRDAEAGVHSLYVDGVSQSSFHQCVNPESSGPFTVGRAKFAGNEVDFWAGAIDEIRVYDRALSGEEVAQLFESGP